MRSPVHAGVVVVGATVPAGRAVDVLVLGPRTGAGKRVAAGLLRGCPSSRDRRSDPDRARRPSAPFSSRRQPRSAIRSTEASSSSAVLAPARRRARVPARRRRRGGPARHAGSSASGRISQSNVRAGLPLDGQHSRFTQGPRRHAPGRPLGEAALSGTLTTCAWARTALSWSQGLVVETLRVAVLLHDVGMAWIADHPRRACAVGVPVAAPRWSRKRCSMRT